MPRQLQDLSFENQAELDISSQMGVKDLPLLGGKCQLNNIRNKGLSQEAAPDVNIMDLRNKVVAIDVAAFVFPRARI